MNFLNKAYEKYQEYAPKLMELNQEVMDCKMEYEHPSDRELVNELNNRKNNPPKRTAIIMLLQERGFEKDSENIWRRR